MPYKDPEKKRAKDKEYYKERAPRPRNTGQSRKHMKDRNRPKVRTNTKDDYPGGLTTKEIEVWCDRVSTIRTAILLGVFKPQVCRWPDST